MAVAINPSIISEVVGWCRTSLVDFIGFGDSRQLYSQFGMDDGWQRALLGLGLTMYGTGIHALGEGSGGDGLGATGACYGSAAGLGRNSFSGVAGDSGAAGFFNNSGNLQAVLSSDNTLRAANADGSDRTRPDDTLKNLWNTDGITDYSPCDPVYVAATNTAQYVAMQINRGHPINIDAALNFSCAMYHWPAGTNAGTVQARWNVYGVGYTGTAVDIPSSSGTGYGAQFVDVPLSAGARAGNLICAIPSTTSTAPWGGTFMRITNTSIAAGFAYSTMYALGSKNAYHMAKFLLGLPSASLDHYLTFLTRAQGSTKRVVLTLWSDVNDRAESNSIAGAPGADSTKAGYKFHVKYVVDTIAAACARLGITFRAILLAGAVVSASADSNIANYIAAQAEIAAQYPDTVCAVDISQLHSWAEMTGDGSAYTLAQNTNATDLFSGAPQGAVVGPVQMRYSSVAISGATTSSSPGTQLNASGMISGTNNAVRITGGSAGTTIGVYQATGSNNATAMTLTTTPGISKTSITGFAFDVLHWTRDSWPVLASRVLNAGQQEAYAEASARHTGRAARVSR